MACHHHKAINTIDIPSKEGVVGYKVIVDPALPQPKLTVNDEFVAPEPDAGNRLPEYPADLVPLNLQPYSVGIRIVLDDLGNVAQALASPVVPSTQGPYKARFESTVRSAAIAWKFSPAAIRYFKDGPDSDGDGLSDYKIMNQERIVKVAYDLLFTFEVKNGRGIVRSAADEGE